MPTDIRPLTMDPATDPWERQPTETIKRFGQFTSYRDAGRARTLRTSAETLALSPGYVREVAAAYHWTDRAEAWDRHRDQLHQAAWLDARREAAQRDASILDGASTTLAARLATLDPAELTPTELIRALDVVLRHRRALYGDPLVTLAVTGPHGGPVTVDTLAGLSPEQRREQITTLARSILRRQDAIDGVTDEDD